MRSLLIAALLAIGLAVVGITLVANVPSAHAQVRVFIPLPAPYFYSPDPCPGCWYGTWEGREGYHRDGGEPWRSEHREGDHRGGDDRGRGEQHGGHEGHGR
jgi:hypothetical protein